MRILNNSTQFFFIGTKTAPQQIYHLKASDPDGSCVLLFTEKECAEEWILEKSIGDKFRVCPISGIAGDGLLGFLDTSLANKDTHVGIKERGHDPKVYSLEEVRSRLLDAVGLT